MNIHEHQAKEILKKFGAPVPNGCPVHSLDELKAASEKIKINIPLIAVKTLSTRILIKLITIVF